MTAVALDTLRISKRLREAGFSEPPADAVTGVLHEAQGSGFAAFTTKEDLRELKIRHEGPQVRTAAGN